MFNHLEIEAMINDGTVTAVEFNKMYKTLQEFQNTQHEAQAQDADGDLIILDGNSTQLIYTRTSRMGAHDEKEKGVYAKIMTKQPDGTVTVVNRF